VEAEGAEPVFEAVGLAVPLERAAGGAVHVVVDEMPVDVCVCAGALECFDEAAGFAAAVDVPPLGFSCEWRPRGCRAVCYRK
jgi:hypothetical protein